MPAHDVVGEDLKLRLLIHLRSRRQENRLRLHRSVGFLRRLFDDDFSLKHTDCVVIDDSAIELAARSAGRRVNDLQRRIGAPGAVDKRQSPKRRLGLNASHPDKNLPARQLAAGNESEGAELRALRQFANLGFDMKPGLVPDDCDVPRPGALGQRHDRRRMSLNTLVSAVEYLNE